MNENMRGWSMWHMNTEMNLILIFSFFVLIFKWNYNMMLYSTYEH